jgi:hypothetical protein
MQQDSVDLRPAVISRRFFCGNNTLVGKQELGSAAFGDRAILPNKARTCSIPSPETFASPLNERTATLNTYDGFVVVESWVSQ